MIKIKVDEAYAFDYLSILRVKFYNDLGKACPSPIWDQIQDLQLNLEMAFGSSRLREVLNSDEYHTLLNINLSTYNMLKNVSKYTSEELHNMNKKRHEAKKKLQEKFFGKLTEVKNDW